MFAPGLHGKREGVNAKIVRIRMEHYTLGKLLGRGAWGRVYLASRLDSKDCE